MIAILNLFKMGGGSDESLAIFITGAMFAIITIRGQIE